MLGQRRYRSQHAVGSPSHEATHCTPPRMSMKVRRVRRVLAPQEAIEEDHEKIPRMKVRRVRRVLAPQETIEEDHEKIPRMKVRRVRRVLAPQETIEGGHEKIPSMKVCRVRRVFAPQETIEDEFFLAHVLGWYAPRPHPPPLGFTRNASSNQVPAGFSSSIEKGGRG